MSELCHGLQTINVYLNSTPSGTGTWVECKTFVNTLSICRLKQNTEFVLYDNNAVTCNNLFAVMETMSGIQYFFKVNHN